MDLIVLTLAFTLTLTFINSVDAGKQKSFCNVCRAIVEEANWKISQSDPKKTIQVGSFRVDPQGNQNIKEKTYARSESHVEDIFESICDDLQSYAEMKQEDGSTTVFRTTGRQGQRLQTQDVDVSTGQKLRYQCHDFLENYEEDVMALLQREDVDNYEQVICGAETSVCSGKELSIPLTQLPEVEDEVPSEDEADEDESSDANDETPEDTEEGDSIAAEFENMVDSESKEEL